MAGQMEGADILTIEGLSEEHIGEVLKKCFIEEGAVPVSYTHLDVYKRQILLLQGIPLRERKNFG